MGAGALLYKLIAGSLIGLTAFAPQLATSQQATGTIPSVIRKTTEFSDRGRVYLVNLDSGVVTFIDREEIKPDPPKPEPDPQPQPEPDEPDEPDQDGIDDKVYEHELMIRVLGDFNSVVKTVKADRVKTADQLRLAISSTLAQAGGLNLSDQEIIYALADTVAFTVNRPLTGFSLGKIFADFGVKDRDSLIKALKICEKAFEGVR